MEIEGSVRGHDAGELVALGQMFGDVWNASNRGADTSRSDWDWTLLNGALTLPALIEGIYGALTLAAQIGIGRF